MATNKEDIKDKINEKEDARNRKTIKMSKIKTTMKGGNIRKKENS